MARAHIRDWFLRILGATFLCAFLSLLVQLPVLFGNHGLLPACTYAERAHGEITLFRLACGDGILRTAAIAGMVASLALVCNVAPRACLVALWILYMSFANVGQDFLSFQWDNLLLESAFFALFVTPGGLRPRRATAPHALGVFLMLWLVFRLHVESGAAKLLGGDPTWRDMTALVAYYETAPLPTPLAWWAHQMPVWAHRLCALFSLVVELAVPFAIWGPHRLRALAFAAMAAMQLSVLLTANYGFFNYLSLALCLFVLDDDHLAWLAARIGRTLPASPPRVANPRRTAAFAALVAVLVPLSVVPFLPFLGGELPATRRALERFRSINAYHLFVHMTRERREAVIEGSNDGSTWLPYEFRYKPGAPDRAPPLVAPHQPRVDFQLWFLLLGGRGAPYFDTLLQRLLDEPGTVTGLFAHDPFAGTAPRFVRVAVYRYQFTDLAMRRATGAWWRRELLGYTKPLGRADVR